MLALVCPNCGGPLPAESRTDARCKCRFCSVVLCRVAEDLAVASDSGAPSPSEEMRRARAAFSAALQAGMAAQGDAREALRAALRLHVGLGAESEVVATVALGLAREFEEDHGVDVSRDVNAVGRLAEAYLRATEDMSGGAATLKIPYFSAVSSGPIDFERLLTIADVRALARGERAPSRAAAAGAKPKKKGWWPF